MRLRFAAVASRAVCNSAVLFFFALLLIVAACGGANHNSQQQSQTTGQIAGNWQFSMATPTDSFLGGLQGGFLLQKQNSQTVTGQAVYSIFSPPQSGSTPTLCNSGSATITGNIAGGQNVKLTAVAGTQTFTLSGTLSADGLSMAGTYDATDGSITSSQPCGTAQKGLQWSATLVPPLTGDFQGNFHSVKSPTLKNQVFGVTGTLTQGENIGASSATVTGTLNFDGYPCLANASVNGQVSGSSVILQVIASNGLNVGRIGAPAGFTDPSPVALRTSTSGMVLQGADGYGVSTNSCPGGNVPGDVGDICLALGNSNSCTQPILLSPASLSFAPQIVGSPATTQTITITNNSVSGTPLDGLTLDFVAQSNTPSVSSLSDFDGVANFTERDNCASSPGATFSLAPQQSCTVTIGFSPQQSCPWIPTTSQPGGEPPSQCPFPLTGSLIVHSPTSADDNKAFAVPITGTGLSAIIPSTPELDFGAEALGETSAAQTLSFTNQGTNPVQILPSFTPPCSSPSTRVLTLPMQLAPGVISGLQVETGSVVANVPRINYSCDSDPGSGLPNFQILSDGCSGTLLMPQIACIVTIAFAPQPNTALNPPLDYFLELNTLQCTGSTASNCEIDSGRFPVELKANIPSPLRMTPSAGLNFGLQPKGSTSAPMTITLTNDPKDPHAGPVTLTGNLLQGSSFAETDNCLGVLASGHSCTLTFTFTPRKTGFQTGTLTVGYTPGQTQTIYLRGTGE